MNNKYTKKQIEELYNCKIIYEEGFYTAHGLTDENGKQWFGYADGWNLDELHDAIRENLYAEG